MSSLLSINKERMSAGQTKENGLRERLGDWRRTNGVASAIQSKYSNPGRWCRTEVI